MFYIPGLNLFIWEARRDDFYSSFENCLYGKRDGMFYIPALKTVYMGCETGRFIFRV